MISRLSDWFIRQAKGWVILLALIAVVICEAVLLPRAAAKIGGQGPLDLKLGYRSETAFSMLGSYGEAGRAAYRTTELTTDIVFPIAYTLFFALSISWLYQHAFDKDSRLQRVNLIPVGGWLFDLSENIGIVTMLSIYPTKSAFLAGLTSIFTGLKWGFFALSVAFLLFGLLAYIVTRFRK
jgi:hypothetical protein